MIGRFLSWLKSAPVSEPEQDEGVEEKLVEKKESLDRSIERGRLCADKLKRSSDKQVAEANVVIATLRGLLTLLDDKEENP
jgi:hypothetical protein